MSDVKYPPVLVDLPSKGLIYPKESSLSKGYIELRQPTAQDENILVSKTLINKGIVFDRFIGGLIIDKTINLDDISIGDFNALMYASRVISYGTEYPISYRCEVCGSNSKVNFDLSDIDHKKIDFDLLNRENEYFLTLNKSGDRLKIKLLTHGDEKRINKNIKDSKKLKNLTKVDDELSIRMAQIILDIEGLDLPDENPKRFYKILAYVKQMNIMDSRQLRKFAKDITPNMDTLVNIECSECGEVSTMELPINREFFYPTI